MTTWFADTHLIPPITARIPMPEGAKVPKGWKQAGAMITEHWRKADECGCGCETPLDGSSGIAYVNPAHRNNATLRALRMFRLVRDLIKDARTGEWAWFVAGLEEIQATQARGVVALDCLWRARGGRK